MRKYLFIILIILSLSGLIAESNLFLMEDLNKPESILVDESQIYVTENSSIYIYSKKDFKLVKKFGKSGEGPQEFKINKREASDLFLDVSTKNIIIYSKGKVSWFTKKGEFIKEMKFYVNPALSDTRKIGNNYVGMFISQEKKRFRGLRVYDKSQQLVKEIVKMPDVFQYGKGMDIFTYSTAHSVSNNKLFTAWGNEFSINVFDEKLKLLRTIKYPYNRVKVMEKDKKDTIDSMKKNPTTKEYMHILKPFKFASHFPAIRNIFVSGDKLYAVTYKKKENKTELLVFKSSGDFFKQIFFPLSMINSRTSYPYTICNDTVFQIEEDIENEEWKLRVTKI